MSRFFERHQVLFGFAAGVGAGVLTALTYGWMPEVPHIGGQSVTGFGDTFVFGIIALFCFSIIGTIIGVFGATICRDSRRQRGLWLGAGLGMLMGLGHCGLFLLWSLRLGFYIEPKFLCFIGPVACVVLGTALGGISAWRSGDEMRLLTGCACGIGAGMLATMPNLFGGIMITGDPDIPEFGVWGVYALVCGGFTLAGFTIIGGLLAVASRLGPKPLWPWATVPVLLVAGPVLGYVLHRVSPPLKPSARDQLVILRENAINAMYPVHVRLAMTKEGVLLFYCVREGTPMSFVTRKEIGEAGTLCSTDNFPDITSASVAWPAARQFEVTLKFDPKGAQQTLKVFVVGFSEVEATCDQKPMDVPAELPPGKHLLVIKGRCP